MACTFCNPIAEKAWQNIKLQFELLSTELTTFYTAYTSDFEKPVEVTGNIIIAESDHEISRDAAEFLVV